MMMNDWLKRRLQAIAVSYLIFSGIFRVFIAIPILIYLALYTRYYWIPLLYLIWFIYDHETPFRGGRRVRFFCDVLGSLLSDYFPIQVVKTADLPDDRNYVFGCHPHGLCSFSYGATFSYWMPQYFLMFGTCPASRESIEYILGSRPNSGHGVAIVVGGAREVHYTYPKTMDLVLKNRKGFVRMALRHGASLVPVISFGENDLYDIYPKNPSRTYRNIQKRIYELVGVLYPYFNGRGIFQYTFGLLPHRKPIHVVVGRPINVDKIETPEPSIEQLDRLHQRYIEELTKLYYEHRDQYGYGDVPLQLS